MDVESQMKRWQGRTSGSVLAGVLVVIGLLLIIGGSMLVLGWQSRMAALRATAEIRARAAADSGLEKAVYDVNARVQNGLWDDTNLPAESASLPGTEDQYDYTLVGDAAGGLVISANGRYRQTQRTVSAAVELAGIYEYAIYGIDSIELKNGTMVDGFNYDTDEPLLQIATSSTASGHIDMKNGVTIVGDVLVGVGGDPDVVIGEGPGVTIVGNTYSMPVAWNPPIITVPVYLSTSASLGEITNSGTISSSGKYSSIALGAGKVLTIDGEVELYITGNVDLGNDAEIRVVDAAANPNASLTIYLEGNFIGKNGSGFNNLTQDTQKLTLYGLANCTSIGLFAKGAFYGTVYAPCADIELKNAVEVFGAMVGNSFIQKESAGFHFDAKLRKVSVQDFGVRFVVRRWQE
ncbi:MAG: hypothetical protein BWY71_01368 [Planctomycetes bacterium ADurb.Bin412]|nr:MAG: hypothetical protein BWY71_01368 [Planctomycetes bacterium ADurb.Bin412]